MLPIRPTSTRAILLPCLIFLSVVFLHNTAVAQTVDEQIVKAESAATDSLKVTGLNKIAIKIVSEDITKSQEIVNRSLVLAGKNSWLQADCHLAQALIHRENTRYAKAIESAKQALVIYEEKNNSKLAATTYEKIANIYRKSKDFKKAETAYRSSIDYGKKAKAYETVRKAYKELGGMFTKNGDNPQAFAVLLEQLSYAESIQPSNHHYLAGANMDLAYNRFLASNFEEAVPYALESYEHARITKDDFQLLDAYNTIGVCYKNIKKHKESILWFEKAIGILEQPGQNRFFLSSLYMNVGGAYYDIGENQKGLEYKEKGLKICQELENQECIMNNFISTGLDLIEKDKEYKKGINYLKEAEKLLETYGSLYTSQYVYEGLYKGHSGLGEYEEAFKYISKHLVLRDSIMSTEKQKQVGELEAKYESDKKQQQIELLGRNKKIQELQLLQNQADLDREIAENRVKENSILLLEKDKDLKAASLKKKEAEAAAQKTKLKLLNEQKRMTESENRNQKLIIYGFIAGLVLLVFLLVNIYRGYRQKKKANLEISQQKLELQLQKEIVEEKNKEITDSINYAKRLQEAILPPVRMVNEHLKESFIFYKPKDIVAGDFYWMETIEDPAQKSKTVLLAAADCTGHGVPGAMVSVVCSNALNRAVKEFGITDPGKILDKVRELVIETFDKSESEVKDGMDISLLSLRFEGQGLKLDQNPQTSNIKLQWSGANNPLWIKRQNQEEIIEVKADKQPIGKFIDAKPFNTHTVPVEKDDLLYIFTDGYADQFGGPKGKKYKYSNMSKLISEISGFEMGKQKETLRQELQNWQGDLEQVDDVCIIGIRI